jgi:hypothetical protein
VQLVNRTAHPDAELRELAVEAAPPLARRGLAVAIVQRNFANDTRRGFTTASRKVVWIFLAHPDHYPLREEYVVGMRQSGLRPPTLYDWREEFVATLAHEAVHAMGDDDETRAERAARAALALYRRRHRIRGLLARLGW